MDVQHIYDAGLCELCGTCAGVCPERAISMVWDLEAGYVLRVDKELCSDCGTCADVCPGDGFDYSDGAWWRERNGDAPRRDFLGPWLSLSFGWASDPAVRYAGASGGVATAILQGAFARDLIDAALVIGMDPENALAGKPFLARSADEVAAARGSKYTTVNSNLMLRTIREEAGRYAVVGLPCHLQGLRRAQKRLPVLRGRIVFALGIFCGLTNVPKATWVAARRAGGDPAALACVAYRGPGWPGSLRLTSRSGHGDRSALPRLLRRLRRRMGAAALPILSRRTGRARRRARSATPGSIVSAAAPGSPISSCVRKQDVGSWTRSRRTG